MSERAAQPGKPRVVFFDVGETLLRSDPSWAAIYLRACREFVLQVDEAALDAAFRASADAGAWDGGGAFEATMEGSYERIKAFDARVMASVGYQDLPDAFYRRLGELFRTAEAWHVFPEVRGVLDTLESAAIRCSVVSNWVWGLPELLHDLDLAHHFEHVVVSSRIGYEKPHPAIFRHALQLARVRADEAVHVGDNPTTDVVGARGAGIRPILVRRKPLPEALAREPMLADVPVLPDLGGLPALLGIESVRSLANRGVA